MCVYYISIYKLSSRDKLKYYSSLTVSYLAIYVVKNMVRIMSDDQNVMVKM